MTYVSNASVESASNASVVVENDRVIHTTHKDRCVEVQVLQNDIKFKICLENLANPLKYDFIRNVLSIKALIYFMVLTRLGESNSCS